MQDWMLISAPLVAAIYFLIFRIGSKICWLSPCGWFNKPPSCGKLLIDTVEAPIAALASQCMASFNGWRARVGSI
jgi:hypothetical protein